MRFAAIVALAVGLTPAANGLSIFHGDNNDQNAVIQDDLAVPGDSPLKFCQADRSKDIVVIEKIDLSPNPPQAGQEVSVTAVGTVLETIESGAYVKLVVKYGLITLLTTTADLCEYIANVDLECPLEKGKVSISKAFDMPLEVPPGKYTVFADVYTADDTPITCLQAQVVFGRKETLGLFDL